MKGDRGGSADPSVGRPLRPSFRGVFPLGGCPVGPLILPSCMPRFGILGGPVDPYEVHVSLSDSSVDAFLGSVTWMPPRSSVAATSSAELAWFFHRRWVSISFNGYFTYIQIISKDKWNYIIPTQMQVNNAYASIYVRILRVGNGEFPPSTNSPKLTSCSSRSKTLET